MMHLNIIIESDPNKFAGDLTEYAYGCWKGIFAQLKFNFGMWNMESFVGQPHNRIYCTKMFKCCEASHFDDVIFSVN